MLDLVAPAPKDPLFPLGPAIVESKVGPLVDHPKAVFKEEVLKAAFAAWPRASTQQ
jgi:hypothetical protein